jgi:histidinol-phosphate/aromatic aminotransferase/cobyric acid decarboxylase-like protein
MQIPFVDLKVQHEAIREELDREFRKVFEKTAFIMGPALAEFEEAFARYCGVKHAIGVANGTDALLLALKAFGIGPGDEVITAVNTFIATAEAIVHAGATPSSWTAIPRRTLWTSRRFGPRSARGRRPSSPCTCTANPPIWTPS